MLLFLDRGSGERLFRLPVVRNYLGLWQWLHACMHACTELLFQLLFLVFFLNALLHFFTAYSSEAFRAQLVSYNTNQADPLYC